MTGALLALGSAVCYGVADFAGGLLSRRANFAAVALIGQLSGLVLALAAVPLLPATALMPDDLAWGALSGVGTGLGMLFLYRGLSRGAMSVVVPVSAVGGVVLPILISVAILGDRPSAPSWLGIAIAVPALWLVSRNRADGEPALATATVDGLIASVGIALQYIALAQAGPGAGIWPIAVGRLTATLTILLFLGYGTLRLPARLVAPAAATGGTAALALLLYLLATQRELVTIAVVLSSLYPAIPVLLGITALRERLTWSQTAGLVGAGVAIALLTG